MPSLFGPTSPFAGVQNHGTVTRIRPEYDQYVQQKRDLELQTQRSLLGMLTGKGKGKGGGGGMGGGFDALLESVLGDLGQVGDARRGQINEGFDAALNSQLADLSDRGLRSSSLAANLTTGLEGERQDALTGLEDSLLQRRAGAKMDIGLAGLSQQQDILQQLLSMLGQ
jgi:hypothetical protein